MPARRGERELRAERGPILTVVDRFVGAPGRDPQTLAEAWPREPQREQRGDARFAEPFASHIPPHVTASADFREGFEPPPHRALAIAKVIERGEEQQPEEVAKTAIAEEAHFLQYDSQNGKQHDVAPGNADDADHE